MLEKQRFQSALRFECQCLFVQLSREQRETEYCILRELLGRGKGTGNV